jgi:hypothetical protein
MMNIGAATIGSDSLVEISAGSGMLVLLLHGAGCSNRGTIICKTLHIKKLCKVLHKDWVGVMLAEQVAAAADQ